ncbi:unnamed protein product [Ceratitis capitata]|uniref:(Mediterranean fruit fly) hypothetical protein n=1 Tax=Ceratitis capitata TaxID=7213 RepID=A0A811VDP5_CERCA|nr:unnamed protein product [Ceratitis capitata]
MASFGGDLSSTGHTSGLTTLAAQTAPAQVQISTYTTSPSSCQVRYIASLSARHSSPIDHRQS